MKTYETSVKFGIYYDQLNTLLMLKASVSIPQYKNTKLTRGEIIKITPVGEPVKFIIKYNESLDNANSEDTLFKDYLNVELGLCSPSYNPEVNLGEISAKSDDIFPKYNIGIEVVDADGIITRSIYTGISDDADIDYLPRAMVSIA